MRVENTSEGQIDLSLDAAGGRTTVSIPPAVEDGRGVMVNGTAEVDERALERAYLTDPAVKSWIDDGKLVPIDPRKVAEDEAKAKAAAEKAAAEAKAAAEQAEADRVAAEKKAADDEAKAKADAEEAARKAAAVSSEAPVPPAAPEAEKAAPAAKSSDAKKGSGK